MSTLIFNMGFYEWQYFFKSIVFINKIGGDMYKIIETCTKLSWDMYKIVWDVYKIVWDMYKIVIYFTDHISKDIYFFLVL
jgi:hypothetical protein